MLRSRNIHFFIILFFAACSNPSDQKTYRNSLELKNDSLTVILKEVLYNADTVLLIGHTGRKYKPPGQNDTLPSIPSLVINEKLNAEIIKKQKVLKKAEIDTLFSILTRLVTENEGGAHCEFDPHHSIVIVKNSKISYMDMCLKCHQFELSQGFPPLPFFDFTKWDQLDTFFTKTGARYYQYKGL